MLRLLESCLCPPTPLSLAVSLPRLLILTAIAAPTCVAARCAAPAWRPRLLLPPSPRPLLIVLASLPQLLGSRRPHKPRMLACACCCKLRGVEAPPRRASNSLTDRLARSKVSDAGDRYRLCAVRWPKTRRRLVPQCCCCGSRQRHDQRCRRGAAAHRARSAALPHRRRPGRSERRRRAARDALSVTPACAAAARRLLHC